MFKRISQLAGRPIRKVHDVGCGVGFLIREAQRMKIQASGNDLNGYAVRVMQERFGLDVCCGTLESEETQKLLSGSDLVTMTDYIEHSYHPDRDLKIVYENLSPKGLVFITTFHTGCALAEQYGRNWDMYCWNHVYHFDRDSLESLIRNASFKIIHSSFPYSSPSCEVLAEK
jgi:2-polyprenyl-3-methyl-5-hydroxy-6-metoxy-1,4-benzoquinol methylase